MALIACMRALFILFTSCWILDGPTIFGCLNRGEVIPGYQASVPKSRIGSTQALTALCIALGEGPRRVFPKPRRWCATAWAFAVYFSTWVLNVSFPSSHMCSQRIAASRCFTTSPWRIGSVVPRVFSEKCITSVFSGWNEMPLAAPQLTSSWIYSDAFLAVSSRDCPVQRMAVLSAYPNRPSGLPSR